MFVNKVVSAVATREQQRKGVELRDRRKEFAATREPANKLTAEGPIFVTGATGVDSYNKCNVLSMA